MRWILLALLAALLFGASTPASKSLLRDVPPLALAGYLYLGAALGALPGWRRGMPRPRGRGDRARLAGAVVFGGILGPVLLLLGLRSAPAVNVSLWLNLELVATALLGLWIFRDPLGPRGWLAAAGILGAGILLTAGEGSGGAGAVLLVALACLCWGVDNHLTALIDTLTPLQTTFWKGAAAGSVNLALAGATGGLGPPALVPAALAVGALAYGTSIALYITAARNLGATRAQIVFASAPFLGAGLSWLALGERLGAVHGIAMGVLVGSLGLLFRDRHSHRHHHEALVHEHSHRHDDDHHLHIHPGLSPSTRHTHRHEHEPMTHTHPHWPDLHHRHEHASPPDKSTPGRWFRRSRSRKGR